MLAAAAIAMCSAGGALVISKKQQPAHGK